MAEIGGQRESEHRPDLISWRNRHEQQELNGLFEVAKTRFLGLALTIGAGNFQTSRPKTALIRLAPVNNSRELFHALIYSPSCGRRKMVLFRRRGVRILTLPPARNGSSAGTPDLSGSATSRTGGSRINPAFR